MRLFLAIKPDRPAEAQLARRLLELQDVIGPAASVLRWTPGTNVHVTLQFLGELETSRLPLLLEALGKTIDEPPFEIELGALGAFPPAGPPRILWVELVKGLPTLERLHTELGLRVAKAGLPLDSKPFSPHLTVARVPDRDRGRAGDLRAHLAKVSAAPITWTARHITLFESDLSGSVPRYEGVCEIECAS